MQVRRRRKFPYSKKKKKLLRNLKGCGYAHIYAAAILNNLKELKRTQTNLKNLKGFRSSEFLFLVHKR